MNSEYCARVCKSCGEGYQINYARSLESGDNNYSEQKKYGEGVSY